MTLHDFWPLPDAVLKCAPSEAEVISNAAFLAVHQPIRLFRRPLKGRDVSEVPAGERAVLDDLLNPHMPEGYVVVPIVGPSGVGKSHLIRWLGLHVAGNRHVIRIPKSTSLRRILESILNGLEGPVYDEIREKLKTAREQLDAISAEEDLLAKFRAALRKRRDEAKVECNVALQRDGKVDPRLRSIAETHGDGLYALLEGQTKDALLRDTAEQPSVFKALVRRVTTGVIEAEHGEFKPAHFEFPAVATNKIADPKLQKYLQKLKTNIQNERDVAAALMNEVRDWAVGQLLGLGENQLADLFRRVREELLKQGKELVLLIEDFTTLAGVQRGLLDVIKMEGIREGRQVLCTLRTALAVTEGFLSDYDTITTRANHEFVIREQPADELELREAIMDMVGAYLNAARLGPDRLDAWFATTGGNPDAKPPAFDEDATDLRPADRSALTAFGASRRGHSLFPFNRAAVRQLAHQHLSPGGHLLLNPRKLIKDVLHATLLYHRDVFTRGEFPPEGFHQFNPTRLGMDVERWLKERRPAAHGRYAVLLGYWGDRPRQPEDVKLPAAVYTAFGLAPLTEGAIESPPPPLPPRDECRPVAPVPPAPPPVAPPTSDPLQEAIEKRLNVLERWAVEKKIGQTDATTLRNDLLEMIDSAIDWDAELLSGPRDLQSRGGKSARVPEEEDPEADGDGWTAEPTRFPRESLRTAVGPNWVYLPFSQTATGATADDALFTVCADDDANLLPVRFELRALVRFHTRKTFDYDGGDEDRAWYGRLCERAVRQAIPFLRKRFERVPDNAAAVDAVAQSLYVSARVLDLDGAHSNQDAEVIKAVLHPGPGGVPGGAEKGDAWQSFRQTCAANRGVARDFLLRRLAARQGGGDTLYAIDAARLLMALEPARRPCRVQAAFPGERSQLDANAREVRDFVTAVGTSATDAAVKHRREALTNWAKTTRDWLGPDFEKKAFAADCMGLLKQAKELGVYTAEVGADEVKYETLRGHAKAFGESAVTEAIDAVDRLKDDATPGVVLTALVQAPDDAMRAADTFRKGFVAFEKQTRPAAVAQIKQKLALAGADADADPVALLPAASAKLVEDLDTLAASLGEKANGPPVPPPADARPETSPGPPVGDGSARPERFAELRAALDRLSRVDTVAQRLKQLEEVQSELNGWARAVPELVAQYDLFAGRGVPHLAPAPPGEKVLNAVGAARIKLRGAPNEPWKLTGERTFTNLKAAVVKLSDSYQGAIASAWTAWVQAQRPNVEDAELVPFEKNPDYQQLVEQIRKCLKELRQAERDPATSATDFAAVEDAAGRLRDALGKLPIDAPPDVRAFFAATNTKEGAPLSALTAPVEKWLKEHGQYEKYRIRR